MLFSVALRIAESVEVSIHHPGGGLIRVRVTKAAIRRDCAGVYLETRADEEGTCETDNGEVLWAYDDIEKVLLIG